MDFILCSVNHTFNLPIFLPMCIIMQINSSRDVRAQEAWPGEQASFISCLRASQAPEMKMSLIRIIEGFRSQLKKQKTIQTEYSTRNKVEESLYSLRPNISNLKGSEDSLEEKAVLGIHHSPFRRKSMKEVPSCLPQGNRASKQAAPFTCLAVLVLFPSACMQSGALYTAFQDQRPKRPRRCKHKCCRVEAQSQLQKTTSGLTMLKFTQTCAPRKQGGREMLSLFCVLRTPFTIRLR